MTISDVTIIYLACGTPFGVHYFLKYRNKVNFSWLKALLVLYAWIPFALLQLHAYFTNRLNLRKNIISVNHLPTTELDLDLLKKRFESFLPDDYSANSLFIFREIIETYAGLTEALTAAMEQQKEPMESGIFKIAGHQNAKLGSVCLSRRNLSRLISHQRESRKEFVNELKLVFRSTVHRSEISDHSLEFVKLLCDDEAFDLITDFVNRKSQENSPNFVNKEESILWNLEKQKRSTQLAASQNLKTLTASAHLLKKN